MFEQSDSGRRLHVVRAGDGREVRSAQPRRYRYMAKVGIAVERELQRGEHLLEACPVRQVEADLGRPNRADGPHTANQGRPREFGPDAGDNVLGLLGFRAAVLVCTNQRVVIYRPSRVSATTAQWPTPRRFVDEIALLELSGAEVRMEPPSPRPSGVLTLTCASGAHHTFAVSNPYLAVRFGHAVNGAVLDAREHPGRLG